MIIKIKLNYPLKLLVIQALLLVLFSCKTTEYLLQDKITDPEVLPVEVLCPEEIVWKNVKHPGVPYGSVQITSWTIEEINAQWKCIKIDLDTPGIEIVAEPGSENLGKTFYLKDFALEKQTAVAINTVPFDLAGKTYIPVSVVKIDNQIIIPPNSKYAALGLKAEQTTSGKVYRALIIDSQNDEEILECEYAFGGFYTILKDDEIFPFTRIKRSRSGAGISDDGRYLYLFAGCGINYPTGRNGFNFEECALIFQKLGCTSAMEFDGGHSTGLTLNNQNSVKPSMQRRIPAALGIKFFK